LSIGKTLPDNALVITGQCVEVIINMRAGEIALFSLAQKGKYLGSVSSCQAAALFPAVSMRWSSSKSSPPIMEGLNLLTSEHHDMGPDKFTMD
jgi:hypothetical protein